MGGTHPRTLNNPYITSRSHKVNPNPDLKPQPIQPQPLNQIESNSTLHSLSLTRAQAGAVSTSKLHATQTGLPGRLMPDTRSERLPMPLGGERFRHEDCEAGLHMAAHNWSEAKLSWCCPEPSKKEEAQYQSKRPGQIQVDAAGPQAPTSTRAASLIALQGGSLRAPWYYSPASWHSPSVSVSGRTCTGRLTTGRSYS